MIQIYILIITLLTQTKAVDLNINFRFSPEVEKRLMTFAEEITKEYNFTNEINFTNSHNYCFKHEINMGIKQIYIKPEIFSNRL